MKNSGVLLSFSLSLFAVIKFLISAIQFWRWHTALLRSPGILGSNNTYSCVSSACTWWDISIHMLRNIVKYCNVPDRKRMLNIQYELPIRNPIRLDRDPHHSSNQNKVLGSSLYILKPVLIICQISTENSSFGIHNG